MASAQDDDLNWVDVQGQIYTSMPVGNHHLVFYTHEGVQSLENVEGPFIFEADVRPGWTRIRFAKPWLTLNEIVRRIFWKPS